MSDQLTAFEPTESDLLRRYELRLEVEAEKLAGSLVKTKTRLDETMDELAQVRRLLDAAPDTVVTDSVVRVTYSGGGGVGTQQTLSVPVGERTRAAALIYTVCEQLGVVDVIESEWTIVAAEDGSLVAPKHVVTAEDWGREFVVVRTPQSRTVTCPSCEGDGRPFAKDGSRNGNAKCKLCGGSGEVAA